MYTTADVCKVLGCGQATLMYRLRAGIYPEPKRRGDKRRFAKAGIKLMKELTKDLVGLIVLKASLNLSKTSFGPLWIHTNTLNRVLNFLVSPLKTPIQPVG